MHPTITANERLKRRFGPVTSGSMVLATAGHFGLLAFFPPMEIDDASIKSNVATIVAYMAPIDIPPPPPDIARPLVPLLGNIGLNDLDITMGSTVFVDNPVTSLPPPPTGSVSVSDQPALVPMEVLPQLLNRNEYAAALSRRYPPRYRDAGIGGTVFLWVFLDERGTVLRTQVHSTSGITELDDVALEVVSQVARFSPALNRDRPVAVWVQLPVKFETAR